MSGPGVPALWPLTSQDVRLPYSLYFGALVVATFLASPGRETAGSPADVKRRAP